MRCGLSSASASLRALGLEPLLDLHEIRDAADQAVKLRANQHIAFPAIVDGRLELQALRIDARKLLAEDFFNARRLQIAELSLEPGLCSIVDVLAYPIRIFVPVSAV